MALQEQNEGTKMAEEQQGQADDSVAEAKENIVIRYFKDFRVLKETKREYWGLQVINMLDCLAYFAMFNIAVVTLSDDFGFTDAWAGYIYTIFSGLTTIFLFWASSGRCIWRWSACCSCAGASSQSNTWTNRCA